MFLVFTDKGEGTLLDGASKSESLSMDPESLFDSNASWNCNFLAQFLLVLIKRAKIQKYPQKLWIFKDQSRHCDYSGKSYYLLDD